MDPVNFVGKGRMASLIGRIAIGTSSLRKSTSGPRYCDGSNMRGLDHHGPFFVEGGKGSIVGWRSDGVRMTLLLIPNLSLYCNTFNKVHYQCHYQRPGGFAYLAKGLA